MNTVQSLLLNPFGERSYAEKLLIKQLGSDKPDLNQSDPESDREGKSLVTLAIACVPVVGMREVG